MRKELLAKVTSGGELERAEALEVGRDLAAGREEPLQVAALLAVLSARGEKPQEVAGLAEAFREAVRPFPQHPLAVDTCGTGGDNRRTFNVSTAAALTAAALGAPVAKHGNRGVSSACGSADILERAGYPIAETPDEAEARLARHGFAFLFAPHYHPAMAHVAPIRRSLGVRTVFNLLGPMLNPAGVKRQVVGVFDPARMELVAQSLAALGAEHALVIHGEGCYDEAVLHGGTLVFEWTRGAMRRYELGPSDFGLPEGRPEALAGGDADQNTRTLSALLAGNAGPGLRDVVGANAALALMLTGACGDLKEASGRASEALASGAVGRYFGNLIGVDREVRHAQVS